MRPDSDDHLVRYLLGDLPDDEAERLDERSITDDALALRLREIENDLIDRYARGGPFDTALERFDGVYRTSAYLRERVRFAQALSSLTIKADPRHVPARITTTPTRLGWWSLATAALLVMAAAACFGVRSVRLGDEIAQLEARRAAVERQNAELQQERQRTAALPPPRLPAVTATFLLRPLRRGLGNDMTTVALPPGTQQVTLRLQVESHDYTTFWAALRDLTSNRIVWRSGDLPAEASGSDRIVTFTVPANSLVAQRYAVECS